MHSHHPRQPLLSRPAALAALALAACLAGPAQAAPEGGPRSPDDHGLIDSVATKGTDLMSSVRDTVRDGASDLVLSAMNFLGVPYRRGGNSVETGFDCSGFTRHVFENSIGLVLPHRADEQANASGLLKVDPSDLKPGDLVFFNTMRRTFSHVGIYMGDGKFIHSPRTGESVRIEDMRFAYWAHRFTGARRVPALGNEKNPGLAALTALGNFTSNLPGFSGTPLANGAPITTSLAGLVGLGSGNPMPTSAAAAATPPATPLAPAATPLAAPSPRASAPVVAARAASGPVGPR